MILSAVFSGYSWGTFITLLVVINVIVISVAYFLHRYVWTKKSGETKNDKRNRRDDDDEYSDDHSSRPDYRKMSEAVSDYQEVKSVGDELFEDAPTDDQLGVEEFSTADIADSMGTHGSESVESEEDYIGADDAIEDEPESISDEELLRNSNLAQSYYLGDDATVLTSDDYDSDCNGDCNNYNYLAEEEGRDILSSEVQEERLTGVVIQQGEDEPVAISGDGEAIIEEDAEVEDLIRDSVPKDIRSVLDDYPTISQDELEDPEDSPTFE